MRKIAIALAAVMAMVATPMVAQAALYRDAKASS